MISRLALQRADINLMVYAENVENKTVFCEKEIGE